MNSFRPGDTNSSCPVEFDASPQANDREFGGERGKVVELREIIDQPVVVRRVPTDLRGKPLKAGWCRLMA
jgi:hypothetical protein